MNINNISIEKELASNKYSIDQIVGQLVALQPQVNGWNKPEAFYVAGLIDHLKLEATEIEVTSFVIVTKTFVCPEPRADRVLVEVPYNQNVIWLDVCDVHRVLS